MEQQILFKIRQQREMKHNLADTVKQQQACKVRSKQADLEFDKKYVEKIFDD